MQAAIIDDNQYDVNTLSDWLYNLDIEPTFIKTLGPTVETIAKQIREISPEIVIVDYQLHGKNYSKLSGVDIVSALVLENLPAFLLTSYQPADMPDFVSKGRHIPYVLKKSDIDDINLPLAIEVTQLHIQGRIRTETRPFPTIIRVDQINEQENLVYLRIPALSGDPGISMTLSRLQKDFRSTIQEGLRFEADVNIGAVDHTMVFIDSPRPLPELTEEYEKLLRN